jgi:hypothetical protein
MSFLNVSSSPNPLAAWTFRLLKISLIFRIIRHGGNDIVAIVINHLLMSENR